MAAKPVLHAVIAPLAKATLCNERPPRGLVADRDDKVARFLSDASRCERCRVALHEHRESIREKHEANERKLAAQRAARQPKSATPIKTAASETRRVEQARVARERSIAKYAGRDRPTR